MSGIKIMIIVFIALALSLVIGWVVIPRIKRKKLAEAWAEELKIKGQSLITADDLKKEFKKLSNSEIDTLIEFSMKLKDKDYAGMAKMFKEVNPILSKMDPKVLL